LRFDTKIAVVLRDDLPTWQKLNVTAFTVSGIAGTEREVIGAPYEDGSGRPYLRMFGQPVMIFAATAEEIAAVYRRAVERNLRFAIFTEELFATGNDVDNRAAVKRCPSDALKLVGLAFYAERKTADKVLKGLRLHS
jgi:hypothetical protein